MLLYVKKGNKISVYNFFPDKKELINFKKKHLEDIKSVVLHINNPDSVDLLLSSSMLLFCVFDRKEKNGRISNIEDTNNKKTISKYINGYFDYIDPFRIVGDPPRHKSFYSGDLINQDSILLFEGGYYSNNEFKTTEGILLSGLLHEVQPLFSNDINNMIYPDILEYLDEDICEFLNLFSCIKQCEISFADLKFLEKNDLISFSDDFCNTLNRSEEVLKYYNKVKRKMKNS